MELTLYSNCRLTKDYNEVIQSSHLENYLSSLTKVTYSDVGEVYLTRQGTFNVYMMLNGVFQYNYFKLYDEVNSITRYFFIDDIDIVNGTCIITYTEDIWSSYSSYINIIKGEISNLRYGIGTGELKQLPENYVSNNKLNLKLFGTNDTYNTEFNVIVELSIYTPQASGEVVDRNFITMMVDGVNHQGNRKFNFDTASVFAETIYEFMSLGKNAKLVNDSWKNYDVMNVYIIPTRYINNLTFESNVYMNLSKVAEDSNYNFCSLTEIHYEVLTNKNWSIDPTYKTYAIGTLDHFIQVEENGTTIEVGIITAIDNIKFTMYLRVGTSMIDITDSFAYELPVNIQSADITQQQAIARQVKNLNLNIDKQVIASKGAVGIVGGIAQTGIGIGTAIATGGASGIGGAIGGVTSTANTIIDTISNLERNDIDKWQNNVQAYSTSTAIKVNKNCQLNAYYGIMRYEVVPDNESYVTSLIDIVGYRTLIITNSNDFITNAKESQTYNIVKFANVMLYGNIPHSIQAELSAILTKGIKIYFTDVI